MIDWRSRYKPRYLGNDEYCVIEELNKETIPREILPRVVEGKTLTYDEAQDLADKKNNELSKNRIKDLRK